MRPSERIAVSPLTKDASHTTAAGWAAERAYDAMRSLFSVGGLPTAQILGWGRGVPLRHATAHGDVRGCGRRSRGRRRRWCIAGREEGVAHDHVLAERAVSHDIRALDAALQPA